MKKDLIVPTDDDAWIPTGGGKSFQPLRFDPDGWSELMRLEPGSLVGLHRHTGHVHAFNLTGYRKIISSDVVVGPGDYLFEPPGNVDTWQAVGDEPCVVHFVLTGRVEYLDDHGQPTGEGADSATQQAAYLTFCAETGRTPHPRLA